MTLRENAQFIDELRQHYRRLDGLLVQRRDRITTGELCDEVNQCVLNLRRLLFGGVGDPNWCAAAAGLPESATGFPVGASRPSPLNTAGSGGGRAGSNTPDSSRRASSGGSDTDASKTPSKPPSPEEIEEKGKLRAPTGASPVKLEVVR